MATTPERARPRRTDRLQHLLVAVGVAVAGVAVHTAVTSAAAPAARADGACATANGVTVVIDFHQLGGGVYVRCAEQPVGDGFAALRQAGIAFQTASRNPGFMCRIAGLPADDPSSYESSGRTGRPSISREGNVALRHAIITLGQGVSM